MPPVSNTSPLIAFSRTDQLELLRFVAPRIVIPTAVFDELSSGARSGEPIMEALRDPGWIEVRPVLDSPLLRLLKADLGAGEAEALVLGLDLGATVLIDDLAGRAAAARLGIDYLGTFGIVCEAKRLGAIAAVLPMMTALRAAGIYYSDKLFDQVLRKEGEA